MSGGAFKRFLDQGNRWDKAFYAKWNGAAGTRARRWLLVACSGVFRRGSGHGVVRLLIVIVTTKLDGAR